MRHLRREEVRVTSDTHLNEPITINCQAHLKPVLDIFLV